MNRKQFVKSLFYFAAVPLLYIWNSIAVKKIESENGKKPIVLKNDFPVGITFIDSVIINKSHDKLVVFSSKCSHLGCKINKIESNEIVCPCHGSRYTLNGEILNGPASKPLVELEYKMDQKNGNIIVYPGN